MGFIGNNIKNKLNVMAIHIEMLIGKSHVEV